MHIRQLVAEVPSGVASARVAGAIYADGVEQPFELTLPTQRGRVCVDINYRPRGQVVKSYSAVKVRGGSGKVVDKMTIAHRDPVPVELEVWVQGQPQFFVNTRTL